MAKKKEFSGETKINSRGKEVPVEMIRKEHLKKDLIVDRIFRKAGNFEVKLKASKAAIMKDIESYRKYISKINKVDGAALNNLTLSDYGNLRRICVKSADVIQLDDTRQLAEIKIKNCFNKWGKNAHPYLRTVVEELFKTNKEGYVNVTELRALKQYKIDEPEWQEAMELLSSAEKVVGKRQYLIMQFREDINARWKTIDLNFSSAEAE